MDTPSESSWCWRKILLSRVQASSLIVHSIGDGKDTLLWKDPWHPLGILLNRFPQHLNYHTALHRNAKVSALITDNTWNTRLRERPDLADIDEELGSVELDSEYQDEIIWMGGYEGEFTNKSAYHSLRRRMQAVPWSKLMWFTGRIPRHSFITWLVRHKALKTQDKLKTWGVIDCSLCLLCGAATECEEHLFFRCRYSCFVWSRILIHLGYRHQPMDWEADWKWCEKSFNGASPSSMLKKLALNATIYHLWTERNCRVFQSQFKVAADLVPKVIEDVRLRVLVMDPQVDDNADNRALFDRWRIGAQFQMHTSTMHAWQQPEIGWFKINTDGSLKGNQGGYGALIRDHDGQVVAAAARSRRAQTVILHELQGIELGIRLAHRHDFQRVELCMDSSNAMKYISTTKVPPWEAVHTTRRIKEEMRKFAECRVMHAVWETNQAADKLASLLPNHEFIEITPSSFAEDIRKIVFDDARGRKYARM